MYYDHYDCPHHLLYQRRLGLSDPHLSSSEGRSSSPSLLNRCMIFLWSPRSRHPGHRWQLLVASELDYVLCVWRERGKILWYEVWDGGE